MLLWLCLPQELGLGFPCSCARALTSAHRTSASGDSRVNALAQGSHSRVLSSKTPQGSAVKNTCFSTSLMVSSDTVLLAFFAWFTALLRTLRKESLALFVSCLASLTVIIITYLGTGTRIIIPSTSGFRFIPLSLIALIAAASCPRTSGKLAIFTIMSWGDFSEICPSWFNGNFPSFVVLILRFFPNSSLRASITASISPFTSPRLIISSTKAALIFTRAWVCPLPLAENCTHN
uniref:Uncharacterized protein n=1 Tax=Chelydra serpentina TaxID=8475 RepID=A0A8C3RQY9_CHESE